MDRRGELSISTIRLKQQLPPLPPSTPLLLDDLSSILPKDPQFPPYHDVVEPAESSTEASQPPGYTPMYDYLRAQQRQPTPLIFQASNCPPIGAQPSHVPYRDEPTPFIVQIDSSQPPPPAYNELYTQHQEDMQRLIREFDENGSPSEQSEEIFKWVISMILIGLTITAVGLALNWGQPTCKWSDRGFC